MRESVFVLGGGRMGRVAIKDLLATSAIDEIAIGDIDVLSARKMADELGSEKVRVLKADATRPDDLTPNIRGFRVMINATWYEHNLSVMRAALKARVHYLDLGGLFHMTRRQLKLKREFGKAGLVAILGAGESPGITNMLCKHLAEEFDLVREVRIRVGARETERSDSRKIAFPFAVPTVFDEYAKRPVIYRKGFEEVEPLSGEEVVHFPKPVGSNRCHYCLHSEVATLPRTIRGAELVDFKLGISERIFDAIKPILDAGLDDSGPIDVKGNSISPREFAIAYLSSRAADVEPERWVAIAVEVKGIRRGRSGTVTGRIVAGPSKKLGVKNATALLTVMGASIVAQSILEGRVEMAGVLAPEESLNPSRYFRELEERGIKLQVASR